MPFIPFHACPLKSPALAQVLPVMRQVLPPHARTARQPRQCSIDMVAGLR